VRAHPRDKRDYLLPQPEKHRKRRHPNSVRMASRRGRIMPPGRQGTRNAPGPFSCAMRCGSSARRSLRNGHQQIQRPFCHSLRSAQEYRRLIIRKPDAPGAMDCPVNACCSSTREIAIKQQRFIDEKPPAEQRLVCEQITTNCPLRRSAIAGARCCLGYFGESFCYRKLRRVATIVFCRAIPSTARSPRKSFCRAFFVSPENPFGVG